MKLFKVNFLIIFLCFKTFISFSYKNDSTEYLFFDNYPPYINISREDSLQFPFNIEVELNVEKLSDVDVSNDFFYSRLGIYFYTNYDSIYANKELDTIRLSPDYWVEIPYKLGDESYNSGIIYDGYIPMADIYQYSLILENNFSHHWDLRDFPFDQQSFKIKLEGMEDTSLMKLNMFKGLPSTINQFDLGLKDGYLAKEISSSVSYKETNTFTNFIDGDRNKVIPVLTFDILVDRSGSWLFFKLFIGSILAFITSSIVFFIPKNDFDSKIELSVGALFVAIGNRYFVESSMPSVQVLTKADILHNLTIVLIILNILLIVIQRNKKN